MFIVSGVSRGLGRAIVSLLLERGEKVIGIGRSHKFNHKNFLFIECDFLDIKAIKQIKFPNLKGQITLINNAGIIGNIKRMSDQKLLDISEVLMVNTVAPAELTNLVYNSLDFKQSFRLVNISSGAADKLIPSWASYCASKASLNIITEAFFLEEREKGNNIVAYSVSPGVIETDMQKKIRQTERKNFSLVDKFIGYKKNNQLLSSFEAAERLLILLNTPFNGEVKVDLRNLQE